MINFNAFEAAHKKYDNEMYFLGASMERAKKEKMYQGLRILHNVPLTITSVLKIEALLLGGAEVTATCMTLLPPSEDALALLKAAHVPIQIEHTYTGEYDFHLDCCGELMDASPPKIGAVELTQTGSELYKKAQCSYPIVSIDDSDLKLLETLFGTGDGFVRALRFQTDKDLYNKKYVLFGYGKVGRGLARALMPFTDRIVVIDTRKDAMESALKRGLKYIDAREREKIKRELKEAAFVISATGIRNLMSHFYHFNKADFNNALLTNMGAYDEYGKNFTEQDVLFDKKPLNFSIQEPTTMKYLDPVFYAHNSAIDLILSHKIKSGYNAFPSKLARDILKEWASVHQEEFFEIEEYFT